MTIKTTRWSPDTCECVIEYTWDDTEPETTRIHSLDNYISRCPAHSILPTDTDRWNTLLEENPRKNIAHQLILDNGPSTLYDIVNGARVLKGNIGFNISWSGTAPNRVLTITLTGVTLTTNQKNTIRTFLDSRFGAGKVILT